MGATKVSVALLPETTLGDLHVRLAEAFGLATDAQLRLLSKGKAVAADHGSLAVAAGLKAGTTIMVMHSKTDEITQVQTAQGERMRGFAEDDERVATGSVSTAAPGGAAHASRSVAKTSPFRFHQLSPLSPLPPGAKPAVSAATARLSELASDRAILKILEEHEWSIGKLSEMPPEGQVGVSASCLMGLNKNKGQEILLRLRTDDWQGMRTYLSVVDVLLHELTHCVWSDHDDNFKALNSKLKMEYAQHRAREQRGQSAGGGDVFQRQAAHDDAAAAGHTLGGSQLTDLPPAAAAAAAAAARLGLVATPDDAMMGKAEALSASAAEKQAEAHGTAQQLERECEDCMDE